MENKAHALAAGAFVLLVAALLVALAIWLTRDAGVRRVYEVSTRDAVTGLQSQASVRFRGVKIGKVAAIGLDALNPGQVLLRLDVDASAPITRSTYATLGYQGLTGIAFVELDDSGESREPVLAVAGQAPRIPMHPSLMAQWSRQGERILSQLEETTRRVNQLLGAENQQAMRKSLAAVAQAASAMPPSLQSVREAAASVSAGAAQVRTAATDYARLAQRLQQPGGTLEQLQQGVGALADTGQAVQQYSLPRLNRTLDAADRTVRQLGRAAARLDENPQALIYGPPPALPGPGEPGFVVPGGAR